MSLDAFDVSGEPVVDDSGEELSRGEPRRSLVRYLPDGSETYVFLRMNVPLLAAAAALAVVRVEPSPAPGELLADGRSLGVAGHLRNFELFERVCADIEAAASPSRFLAFETGHGRRDLYFATEDPDALEGVVRRAAVDHELRITRHTMAALGPRLLPAEMIGALGLALPVEAATRRTRFEFWGAPESLERLRLQLDQRGYQFLEVDRSINELRMAKVVPLDGTGFNAVLREIVPLARSLRCSYRGTETVDGFDQFALDHPLPERYAAAGRSAWWRRLLG
jgi:hypothetical protein